MFPEPDLIFEHLYPLRKRRVKLGDGGEVISPSYQLIKVEDSIHKIISILNEGGHKALIIGGAVRDALLGVAPKDIDIEVYKISYEELERVLSEYGKVDLVGQTFGVILFQPDGSDMTYDFSIPRKENKVGVGHKGFKVFFDKDMTIKEASTRRDFTFNALAYDPLENKIYDYFGGVKDLEDKVIRHTSDAFKEDALRVLRALQFQSRFDFSIHPDTLVEMRKMVASEDFDDLPRERLFGEFNKWAIKGVRHDLIFQFMRDTGLIEKYPELKSLAETPQDYIYHPEGNVEIHTTMTLVEMDKIIARENIVGEEKLLLVMSILLHDIGKPATTKEEFKRGRLTITSNGHEALGGTMSRDILAKMGFHEELITPVDNIVSNHLAGVSISMIPRKSGKLKAVKKLSRRLYPATIKQLMYVIEADNRGRGGEQKEPAGMSDLAELSIEADILNKPYESILKGRDLIAIGLKPSPKFGEIIRASFEAQESGEFSDLEGAKKWLLDNVNKFNAGGGVNDAEFSRMDNPAGKIFTDGDNFYKINNFVFDKMYYSEVVPPLFFSKGLIDTIEISRGELMSKFKDGKYRWVHAGGGKTGDEIESEKLYNRKNNVDESRGIEYHGTSKKNMESIRRNGFKKEFNVNITTDIDEAKEYASYYGNPAVLKVRLKKGAKPIAERGLDANAFHADDVVLDYSEVSNKNYGKHDEGMSLLYGDKMEKGGAVSEKSDSKQPSAPAPVIDADVGGRGGLVVGDSHAESPIGGVPFILEDSGTKILEEGEEANIPVEVREIKKEYTLKGKNHEIVHRILQMVGLKLSDKVSSVKSGDLVISKASLWDDKVRTYKGTPIQILSAVNESKGGNHIESGAVMIEDGKSVKMESGGAVGYDKEIKILSGGKNKKSGELIGIGSAREIYDIGSGKVKKVSYNKKGVEQNKNEVFINENSDSDIIPKLFDYDKKYKWIMVEKADYATENKMDDYFKGTGFSFWDIEYYIWNKQEQDSKKYKVISGHSFVKALVELKNKFGLDSNDLSSYKNYGFIKGKLKLIDYGMTDKTKKDFYSKNDGKEISEEDAVKMLYGKSDSSVMAGGGEFKKETTRKTVEGKPSNRASDGLKKEVVRGKQPNRTSDGFEKSELASRVLLSRQGRLTNPDSNNKGSKFSNGGKILLAPNGEPSNLNEGQWNVVRSSEFKNWFGDFEKNNNINKFYGSEKIIISDYLPYKKESELKLYRQNILNYIEKNKLGFYVNNNSGIRMRFSKRSLRKILSHTSVIEIAEALNYIDEIIFHSSYMTCGLNIDPHERKSIPYYHYLFSEIEFKGRNYVAYLDIKETRNKDDKYVLHDFTLFEIERSELASRIRLYKHERLTTPDPLYHKGKKLSLIFDTSDKNISKVVDENGEPLICYHGTNKKFSVFDEKMKGSNTPDNNTKYGFFFSKFKDEARVYMREAVWKDTPELYDHLYGGHILEVFLNIKNPAQLPYAGSLNTGKVEMALREGMDGIIDERGDYVTFYPEQIKLADGSNKIFDGHNPDIRYGTGGEVDESNYFQNTKGEFEIINKEEYDSVDAEEFVSEFGSRYKVKDGMLYRGADHWGVFGTVIWSLKNKEYIGDSFEGELDTGLDGYDKLIYAKIPFRSLSFNSGIVVDEGGLVKVWVSMTTNSARAGVTPFIEVHPSLSIDDVRNVVAGKYPDYAYFKYRGTRHTQ